MKKQVIGTLLLCLFASDAYAFGNGLQFGDFQINPAISEIFGHNSNVTYSSTPVSSWDIETVPQLKAIGGSFINYVTLDSYYDTGHYIDAPRYDFHDYYASLSTHDEPSSRSDIDTNIYYHKGHAQVGNLLIGTSLQLPNSSVYRQGGISASFTYGGVNIAAPQVTNTPPAAATEVGHLAPMLPQNVDNRFVVTGSYSRERYMNNLSLTQKYDNNITYADGIFYYQIASRIAMIFEGNGTYNNYFQPSGALLKNTTLAFYTGLSWEITGKTRGLFKVGMQNKRFTATSSSKKYFSYEAQVEWLPRAYSTVLIASGIRSTPAYTATSGNFGKRYYGNVTWGYDWSSRLKHSISLYLAHTIYTGGASTLITNSRTIGVSVSYLIVPWLNIGAVYDNQNRISNSQFAHYSDNIYLVSLNAAL